VYVNQVHRMVAQCALDGPVGRRLGGRSCDDVGPVTTSPRIVVLGSLNADLVVSVPRLPRPAETVLGDRLRTYPGGKGANQAVAAARLGGSVCMVGRVGQDAFADLLLRSLAADGVDTAAVERDPDEPTGVALIVVEQGGQNLIAVAPGANARVDAREVDRAADRLNSGSILLLELEVPVPTVEQAVVVARQRGSRVILNAAPASSVLPETLLRQVDVLIVNEVEAATLFGCSVGSIEEAAGAGRAALDRGSGAAIVTLGAAGAVVVEPGGVTRIEPYRVVAIDATAAGDAFVGALALSLARGVDLVTAARLAAAAGAAAVTRPGAQSSLPTQADLQTILDG
jgi:ribokinase